MSFYTSLSGLKAAQTDLGTIANNVANVGTTGFKKSRAEFGDIFSTSSFQTSATPGLGTRLKGITQEFTQGAGFKTTGKSLDLAISGQGFFTTRSDVTGGTTAFTRDGAFGLDSARYVTDSSGNYLQVLPVDNGGNVTATGLAATRNLQIPLTSGQAQATSDIDLSVTFPADADIPANRSAYTAAKPYAFDRFDPNSYNYSTATTVYDATGNALPATIYYTRTGAPDGANTDSTWQARMFVGNNEVSADGAATTPATPLTLTFDAAGRLTSPTTAVTYGATQPSGATAPLNFTVDYGTATAQSASPFTLKAFTQNGFSAGQLDNVAVGNDGLVTATFSNGTTQKLGKLAMATFSNPSGLRQLGDSRWGVTGNSGDAVVGEAGSDGVGEIQSGSLEQANVDITEELVALITAQRNFQANAKAIDTANQMTQIAVNLRGS